MYRLQYLYRSVPYCTVLLQIYRPVVTTNRGSCSSDERAVTWDVLVAGPVQSGHHTDSGWSVEGGGVEGGGGCSSAQTVPVKTTSDEPRGSGRGRALVCRLNSAPTSPWLQVRVSRHAVMNAAPETHTRDTGTITRGNSVFSSTLTPALMGLEPKTRIKLRRLGRLLFARRSTTNKHQRQTSQGNRSWP